MLVQAGFQEFCRKKFLKPPGRSGFQEFLSLLSNNSIIHPAHGFINDFANQGMKELQIVGLMSNLTLV